MKFLDGYKTILGIIGTVLTVVLPALGKNADFVPALISNLQAIGANIPAIAAGASALLMALGIIHKVEKTKDGTP